MTPPASTPTWAPDGPLTIDRAATLWPLAAEAVSADAGETVHVDLAQVERIDTAGCQILVRLASDAQARGLVWQLTGCSAGVAETIGLLGCGSLLVQTDASGEPT